MFALITLIFGILISLFWGYTVISTYYMGNISHYNLIDLTTKVDKYHSQATVDTNITILSAMSSYFLTVFVIYLIYKAVSIFLQKKKVSFSFLGIFGFVLLQILLISIFYTNLAINLKQILPSNTNSGLFFMHIIQFLLYPIFLLFLWRGVGCTILSFFSYWKNYFLRFRVPVEIALGMGIFTIGLLILGAIGQYTFIGLGVLCVILLAFSWRGWVDSCKHILSARIQFSQHTTEKGIFDFFQPKLLSVEFTFIILSLVFAVGLISILRPVPIGWDDLGVYMNFPKIMAHNGTYLHGASMFGWQLITGTGYLFFNTAAQAFFINQMGGFLAVIAITSLLSILLEQKNRRYFISLPILLASVYYVMPMTVFQQAKDMKLDPALMFISVSAMMTLWYGLKALLKQENPKKGPPLISLAGILVGFAFGVKFTTLLLILAGLGYIGYRALGIFGFIGFWGIFVAIFTAGGLWSRMFIWLPTDNSHLIQMIALVSAGIGLAGIFIGASLHKKNTLPWIRASIIFILGIGISTLPWLVKNGSEAQIWNPKNDIVGGLLSGKNEKVYKSYSEIYNPEELKIHQEKAKSFTAITGSGQSKNEDFSRYFGQEKGLNNYIKLPANLTIQRNQKGEFTDITYIFLLFVPLSGLFVRTRKRSKILWLTANMILIGFFYGLLKNPDISWLGNLNPFRSLVITNFNSLITPILSNLTLPLGYIFLLIGVLVWQILINLCVDSKHTMSRRYKFMSFFVMTYALLFLVSAFGIVWYGVLVYFMFFVMIALGFAEMISFTEKDSKYTLIVKGFIAMIIFISLGSYLGYSAPRHAWKNLSTSGYNEYKYKNLSQDETIFLYRNDYINSIAAMNLKNPAKTIEKSMDALTSIRSKLPNPKTISPTDYFTFLQQLEEVKKTANPKNPEIRALNKSLSTELPKAKNIFFQSILYPNKDEANTAGIYRIGTFMSYFVNNNRQRFFEDSLINNFEGYFYDSNPDVTVERMKKLGLKYLLVDLNAATIDRDPRHALTKRYDHLLSTMRSKKLKLIDTDNECLRFAVDESNQGKITSNEDFLMIAGYNYVGYKPDGTPISPNQKASYCMNAIYKKIKTTSKNALPAYLKNKKDAIESAGTNNQKIMQILKPGRSYFVLFEVK